MLLAIVTAIVSSLFYYVQAFKTGMPAKKWAVAGFLCGPFILPMFSISMHVRLRQSKGFQNAYLIA
jgi:hypothetical protein